MVSAKTAEKVQKICRKYAENMQKNSRKMAITHFYLERFFLALLPR